MNINKIDLDSLDREELAKVIDYAMDKREKDLNVNEDNIKNIGKDTVINLSTGQVFHNKIPLGVKPRKIVAEERAAELSRAIKDYLECGKKPRSEWIDELWDLSDIICEY